MTGPRKVLTYWFGEILTYVGHITYDGSQHSCEPELEVCTPTTVLACVLTRVPPPIYARQACWSGSRSLLSCTIPTAHKQCDHPTLPAPAPQALYHLYLQEFSRQLLYKANMTFWSRSSLDPLTQWPGTNLCQMRKGHSLLTWAPLLTPPIEPSLILSTDGAFHTNRLWWVIPVWTIIASLPLLDCGRYEISQEECINNKEHKEMVSGCEQEEMVPGHHKGSSLAQSRQ